jgi:predicted DNA-binding transcriptional regulator AlpA
MSVHHELPATGFVRLPAILGPKGPIPVSKSTWWAGVRAGRFPKSVKLGPRTTAWRVEDIRALINSGPNLGCSFDGRLVSSVRPSLPKSRARHE